MSMVPEEVSVGTVAPQATSAGGRHLAPAQCGTAPPGLHECFLRGMESHRTPISGATGSAPFLPNSCVCVCVGRGACPLQTLAAS